MASVIKKYQTKACCGKTSVTFKLLNPIDLSLIDFLCKNGFVEAKHFTKSGIIYISDSLFTLTGPIGSDKLTIKCKKKSCDEEIDNLMSLLSSHN